MSQNDTLLTVDRLSLRFGRGEEAADVLHEVSFTVAPAAGASAATEVFVTLENGSTTWYPCTLAAGTWTCAIGGAVDTLDADELRVVAAQ